MTKIGKVVLVDDDDDTNFYNEDLMEESNFFEEIHVIKNGTDTLNYFQELHSNDKPFPELMFLDINMPDYQGFDLLEELEQLFEEKLDDMKVFMLTTSNHRRDLESFDKYVNAVEFLNKPLKMEDLKLAIQKHF